VLSIALQKRRGSFALDVAFDAPTPGVVALFGASGSGKTTVIELIAGLLRPEAGRVEVDGELLFEAGRRELAPERRAIGFVFQDTRLFPHRNVAGNLRYGEQRARTRPATASFEEIVELLGLASLLERRPHQLSGGERQRVAIGRALLARPRLLLLDEPLASIDRARRQEVLPYLERLRDRFRIPIVYVSHQFEEVLRLATHVVLIDGGRVAAQGGVAEVSRDPALRALLGADAAGAVGEGEVECVDAAGVAQVRIGAGRIALPAGHAHAGWRVRVEVRASEVVLSTEPPRGVAHANRLEGKIVGRALEGPVSELVEVDVGGPLLFARVSRQRAAELSLDPGRSVWLVLSAAHVRGGFPGASSS
jgi:molybdate transport system ATP-binding protein